MLSDYLREPEIGNDSRLVECNPAGPNGVYCPNRSKEPEPLVLQGLDDLGPFEVLLLGSGSIRGQAGLDEGLFAVCQPFRSVRN